MQIFVINNNYNSNLIGLTEENVFLPFISIYFRTSGYIYASLTDYMPPDMELVTGSKLNELLIIPNNEAKKLYLGNKKYYLDWMNI